MSFKVTRADPKGTVSKTDITAGDVTYTSGSFSLYNVDTSATVSFTALSSSLTYVNASFALTYQNIVPSAVTLGNYLLKENLKDSFFVSEFNILSTGKNFFGLVTATEDIVTLGVTKAFADTFSVAEQIDVGLRKNFDPEFISAYDFINYLGVGKSINENLLWTETLRFDTSKVISDQFTAEENISKGFARPLSDQFSYSDSQIIGSGKVFFESLAFDDSTTLASGKVLSDTVTFTDAGITYSLSYNIADAITATDDFLGEANLDDDQTMQFNKNTTNLVGTTDSFSRQVSFVRDFSDSASYSDTANLSYFKSVTDASSTIDDLVYVMAYNKSYSDLLSISDTATTVFGRLQQDNGTASDNNVKSTGKVNSDLVNITDTGSLFWQDYVDNPYYFAGDYVGDRQLF